MQLAICFPTGIINLTIITLTASILLNTTLYLESVITLQMNFPVYVKPAFLFFQDLWQYFFLEECESPFVVTIHHYYLELTYLILAEDYHTIQHILSPPSYYCISKESLSR